MYTVTDRGDDRSPCGRNTPPDCRDLRVHRQRRGPEAAAEALRWADVPLRAAQTGRSASSTRSSTSEVMGAPEAGALFVVSGSRVWSTGWASSTAACSAESLAEAEAGRLRQALVDYYSANRPGFRVCRASPAAGTRPRCASSTARTRPTMRSRRPEPSFRQDRLPASQASALRRRLAAGRRCRSGVPRWSPLDYSPHRFEVTRVGAQGTC